MGTPGMRARIAKAVRHEVDVRKRRQRLIDYDDMLIRLNNTLTDPESGPVACGRLRDRYRVVLVDEFQDTDPVQWSILRTAFHGHRTLVLIGDPKQAIYGFRGADVHAYLEAKGSASIVRTLPTNWRSDALLLDGLDAVFHGAALGDPRIRVVPVKSEHTRPDGRRRCSGAAARRAARRLDDPEQRHGEDRRGQGCDRPRPRRRGGGAARRRAAAAAARRQSRTQRAAR